MITPNPLVAAVATPAIAESRRWVEGRSFPADRPLIDLAQAVPADPPADALIDHLAARLRDPAIHRYTEIPGILPLREALAARIERIYGGTVGADRVVVTAGCNQAFCLAVMALAQAGDEVILPLPYYFNHQMWLEMLGIRPRHLAFRADAGGIPDLDEAARAIGPRTRAIVLVTPSNPTGAITPAATIRGFYDLAKRHRIALILDETYLDYLPTDEPAHDLFRDPDWAGTLVHLYSFSKVYSLTGYRVGALAAGPGVTDAVEKALDCVAICAPRIGQEAALFGLRHLDGWVAGKVAEMRGRAQVFRSALSQVPGFRLVSLGAYFAYLEHPFAGQDATRVARRLVDEASLLTLPGTMFGPGQERFLRLAFANAPGEAAPTVAARLASVTP
jgi:aspartate/methionine/tyrosine aminotransferase